VQINGFRSKHSFLKIETERLKISETLEYGYSKPIRYVETTKHVKRSFNASLRGNSIPMLIQKSKTKHRKETFSKPSPFQSKLKLMSLSDARKNKQANNNKKAINMSRIETEPSQDISMDIYSSKCCE